MKEFLSNKRRIALLALCVLSAVLLCLFFSYTSGLYVDFDEMFLRYFGYKPSEYTKKIELFNAFAHIMYKTMSSMGLCLLVYFCVRLFASFAIKNDRQQKVETIAYAAVSVIFSILLIFTMVMFLVTYGEALRVLSHEEDIIFQRPIKIAIKIIITRPLMLLVILGTVITCTVFLTNKKLYASIACTRTPEQVASAKQAKQERKKAVLQAKLDALNSENEKE